MSGSTNRPAPARRARRTAWLTAGVIAGSLSLAASASVEAGPAERQKPAERVAFTAGEAAAAQPDGLIGVRIAGDDPAAFQALIDGASRASDPWLVMSGGGENGAFAAGLLNGWSASGERPSFGVITGVSTGAMIAPFAFVGASEDATLAKAYTEVSAADVFEFGATPMSLTDTWPLKRRIDRSVTADLLKAVAAEHARGRRLLVATTAVDAERPVLWDMGAIATAGGPKALALFRSVILASAAVPGVFPPVLIEERGQDGKAFQDMHADGGTMAPFYLAPEAALLGDTLRLPTQMVYLVINNRLSPDFQMASRSTLSVLGRAMSAAIKAQTRMALAVARTFAVREGIALKVAQIDGRFTKTSAVPFDGAYMRALFAHGAALGRAGTAFTQEEAHGATSSLRPLPRPDLSPRPETAPRRDIAVR
ncbi:patatin-like phospholipase family protein [Methylobacterium sp. Leaf108]|uniref:patatin-like phospholipase family protein n=1 Tax=Methylobacterium sp. Leaf108 TaxID=1736256 RepID=UPI0009E8D92B|nr:patatin-like phospholipase family protein [Methylobacterium sp. Leaf108]